MNIKDQIKGYIAMSGNNITSAAELVGLSRQALTTKINNESIRYKDAVILADKLGYKIELSLIHI